MERLTDDRTAEALKANIDKLKAAGYEVDISNERYVRLAEYEQTGLEPGEIIRALDTAKHWLEDGDPR